MTTVDRILELVKDSGLTAKEFAEGAGLAGGSITDWKTGRSKPSVASLQKISEFTNIDLEWLIGISYFKNDIDKAKLIGYSVGYILGLSKENCLDIDLYINEKIRYNNEDFSQTPFLPELGINKINVIKILYYDYKENKDIYQTLYNINFFSTVSFLKYSALRFPVNETTKKDIEKKINELNGTPDNNEDTNKFDSQKFLNVPVVGKIAAGQPILAEQYIEGYLPVDPNIYGLSTSDDLFYLLVSGQSMNLKVKNGDYALIKKQDYAEDGDIVVAIVNGDDEATLKKYRRLNDQFVLLEPMSTDSTIEAITVDLKNTNFKIIGKAIGYFGKI